MAEFRMPSLGAEMQSGKLIEWRVKPGDQVQRGDIVAVVDTDKAEIEVEIFESGVIDEILVPVGESVPVGTVLATVQRDGAALIEPGAPPEREPAAAPPEPAAGAHRRRVSPLARRLATTLGVELADVLGTGTGGAITKADVERAAARSREEAPETLPSAEAPSPPSRAPAAADRQAAMRRAIGNLMARSKREIPHYYLGTEIDMSRAMEWLERENEGRSVAERLVYSVLLLKAVALSISEVPEMNGFWLDGEFKPSADVSIGVAISLRQGGLIAPAIHQADQKDLGELMRDLRDLVKRARVGVLRSSEMADPTITVTNLGEQGVESVFGVIYPPQVALVGFGKVRAQPWASQGMVGARPTVTATLSGDHRASDGHRGGLFLAAVDRQLQKPEKL